MISANIAGYTFALLLGHFAIYYISKALWANFTTPSVSIDQLRPSPSHPAIVGFIERALYVASIQMGAPQFIGVWLAIKVAGQWRRWGEGYNKDNDEVVVTGREFFNVFLIGSGLSIAYALVGALIIGWLQDDKCGLAVLVALVLVFATAAIFGVVKWNRKGGPV